jgi:hypothetical protein
MKESRNTLLVPVDRARSVGEFVGLASAAARRSAPASGS